MVQGQRPLSWQSLSHRRVQMDAKSTRPLPEAGREVGQAHTAPWKRHTGNNDRVNYAPTMSVSKTIVELIYGLMYLLNCNCNKSFDQTDGIRRLLFAPSVPSPLRVKGKGLLTHIRVQGRPHPLEGRKPRPSLP